MGDLRSTPRALLVLWSILTTSCSQAGEPVALNLSAAEGRSILTTDEPVGFELAGPVGRKRWTLTDWQGRTLAEGEATPAAVQRLYIPLRQLGYFELRATMPERPGRMARIAFARLPTADGVRDDVFGVMTHFAQGWSVDLVPLIARIGIRRVRDEQYWASVEREPGLFTFPQAYVRYMNAFAAHGIDPLLEMTFANPIYDGGQTPFTLAGQEAFARYGIALAERYRDQVTALEVWNEINGTWCEGPCRDDRAGTYAGMLAATWKAVKTARPDVTVAGGASAHVSLPWFRKLAARGAFQHLDALATHAYPREPEDIERDLAALAALARSVERDRHLPIWVTEIGSGSDSEAGRRSTAAWLVRALTLLRAGGVERIYWYLLQDYDLFQGMGLLRAVDSEYGRYAPNPAYASYANLIRRLGGASFVRREPSDPRTRIYSFVRDGQEVRVLWSTQGQATIELVAEGPLALIDLMGNATLLAPRVGSARVELDEVPRFLEGAIASVQERRTDRLIADSRLDFEARPNGASWRYGYRERGADGMLSEFRPLVPQETDWGEGWSLPEATDWLALARDTAHPRAGRARQIWCVRRWTSDHAGPVRIAGTLARASAQGDGVGAFVTLDGRELGRWHLPPGGRADFSLDAELRPGSVLDLVVTPGAGDDLFDATVTTVTIAARQGDATPVRAP